MACIFYNMAYCFFCVVKSYFLHAPVPRICTGILRTFRHVNLHVNNFVWKAVISKKHLCD